MLFAFMLFDAPARRRCVSRSGGAQGLLAASPTGWAFAGPLRDDDGAMASACWCRFADRAGPSPCSGGALHPRRVLRHAPDPGIPQLAAEDGFPEG